jgi:CspA family cold shock protein
MAKGTIKWFNDAKGFGFIEQDDGPDIFVHHSVIKGLGFKSLTAGDKVLFDIVKQPDGKVSADNVTHCSGPHGGGGGIDDDPY